MTEEKEVATETNGQENDKENNAEEETNLESAVIRQVEYYFSDVNLPRDKFLREQVTLDDGWVPLDVLTKFNRLAKLSTDIEVIANALAKSTSGLLEISDDNKKVRRNPELPIPEMNEERRKEMMARTVYAKGFPKDSTLDDLLKFFKDYDGVENIIMRRYQDRQTKKRHFKGSVFLTFKTKEQADKFMENKGMKHNDTELIVLWQDNYLQMKQEEHAAKKEHRNKKNKEKEEKKEEKEFKLPTGTVLHFKQENEKMTRENINEALVALGAEIAFISYKIGEKEGWVRLTKEDAAKEVAVKIPDGKLTIEDTEVVFKLLEGDEEKAYLDKTIEEMSKRRRNQKNFKQNKGKNYKGKQNRKRKQDDHGDAPPSKVKADS
ncbi:PREDICTED: la protein homolog [Papilio xuthus]|uniref:La protein homolog n=1 Tax=Papilio xuthus TaxID=66420 RepID=A0AAJ7EKW5_PAPXU|nr:PREDICTED: la protein homolog [Papilio xuthus]